MTDVNFEEDLLLNTADIKAWMRFAEHFNLQQNMEKFEYIFERALNIFPWSYQLWKKYIDELVKTLFDTLSLSHTFCEEKIQGIKDRFCSINSIYERALCILPKMPRIWIDYSTFLLRQGKVTQTRTVLDRALHTLPIEQHDRIWSVYLKLASALHQCLPKTAAQIWRRHWEIAPRTLFHATSTVDALISCAEYDSAAVLLSELVDLKIDLSEDREHEETNFGDRLIEIVINHGDNIVRVDGEKILRNAINNRSQDVALFWTALASWLIRKGRFNDARALYEEALENIILVRDFSIVFDSYTKFEEGLLAADFVNRDLLRNFNDRLEFRLARFKWLLERRPFLLSDVKLRQQPNAIDEWLQRIDLSIERQFKPNRIIEIFIKALETINPRKSKGKLSSVWIKFSRYYEDVLTNTEDARLIFEKAVRVDTEGTLPHVTTVGTSEDLALLWIAYAELERRLNDGQLNTRVFEILARGTTINNLGGISAHRSLTLWNYLVDLEEARGLVESTKAAYDRMMQLGVATVQNVINFAIFVEEHDNNLDGSFRIYERGISVFGYPIAFELWNIYIPKAVKRYAFTHPERVRDLFEQAIVGCPTKFVQALFLQYVAFEEEHGLAKASLRILEKACKTVLPDERKLLYDLCIAKCKELFGILSTRPIFEDAIKTLPLNDAITAAQQFAVMEIGLGEFDRARGIYSHAAGIADPRNIPSLWNCWAEFESRHGTEDTFREMLRVKRALSTKYGGDVVRFVLSNDSELIASDSI